MVTKRHRDYCGLWHDRIINYCPTKVRTELAQQPLLHMQYSSGLQSGWGVLNNNVYLRVVCSSGAINFLLASHFRQHNTNACLNMRWIFASHPCRGLSMRCKRGVDGKRAIYWSFIIWYCRHIYNSTAIHIYSVSLNT